VKLSNVAAVLRMRGVVYDLSIIASTFHKAVGAAANADGTSEPATLTRSQFQHFWNILRVTLRHDAPSGTQSNQSTPLLPPEPVKPLPASLPVTRDKSSYSWLADANTRPAAHPPKKHLTEREMEQAKTMFVRYDTSGRGFMDAVQAELALRSVLGSGRFDSVKMGRSFATHSTQFAGHHFVDFNAFSQVYGDMLAVLS
jgi:hypothetical protein